MSEWYSIYTFLIDHEKRFDELIIDHRKKPELLRKAWIIIENQIIKNFIST